ncbi:MAG: septal ring lytic transglycosylase RlpA family lipoprotein, partial [Acidobacteria bacterium]|nr:septal ring lytic transglycosylase RlpA family lipoprotein [Acidobacteriota bacterium]NIQ29452.1 septal ring lytic transglycosylase RlpA family lipoprotein [Acidobacteriota bacterium]NIQ84104.1 septal ring lytic transglycosylase RlpA family lipoprotein [Acidobacteriota bacterium]
INDRGPFVRGRIIDLSREAAKRIDMLGAGTARVRIRVVDRSEPVERIGSFWVQVGAFRERANARDLEASLRRDFADVRIRSEDGWHRVGFGPYSKRTKADEMVRKLDRHGHKALVVGS